MSGLDTIDCLNQILGKLPFETVEPCIDKVIGMKD